MIAPTVQPHPSRDALPVESAATILVVDDDPAMRTILSLSLRHFGYVMLVAGDGEEALALARGHPEIRVILLDVVMTGLSGQELAEQLRDQLPNASILFCSGHPASVVARYNIHVGADNFVQKPCRSADLQEKIEKLLAPG